MDALYREQILDHYKHPHNFGELDDADLEFEDSNPLCGDELRVQLRTDEDGRIEDVRFSGQGCAISQAAASLVSDEVKRMSVGDLLGGCHHSTSTLIVSPSIVTGNVSTGT